MEYRNLKKLNIKTSLLGFGCMRFPTKEGKVDRTLAKSMVDYAVSNGVNYIDTAYFYHNGESELVVKEIIKDYDRKSFYLADKLPTWMVKKESDVLRIFNDQLDKTGVEYFDFYLIHAVNKTRIEEIKQYKVLEKLAKLKLQGKIKYIGFSFHDNLDVFKEAVGLFDWDFCQIQLNYMDTNHQQGIEGYNILTEKDIPVIVMEPIKGGSLAKFNEGVENILRDHDHSASISSWALRWVGSLPNVKVILSGMSTMEHVVDNIKTFSDFKPLDESEISLVDEVKSRLVSLTKVDCTDCKYCMPCEYGVDIPANFKIYNQHAMYENTKTATWQLNNLDKNSKSAVNCVQCQDCVSKCPQNIDIPTELAESREYFKSYGLK